MIQSLHISNYALIDEVDIDFHPGLNIITGETGAGKSIMLGALSLLLGERAEQRMIRDRSKKSIIEAMFAVDSLDNLRQMLVEEDIEWSEDSLILRREISPTGRSRAFINDTPVTAALLRATAIHLVDLHSQHQNLLLASPDYQLSILDALAGNQRLHATYSALYNKYKGAVGRFRRAKRDIQAAADDEEFTRYQLQQLKALELQDGEQQELESRQKVLANLEKITASLRAITSLLINNDNNAVGQIAQANSIAEDLTDDLDDARSLVERLESAKIEIEDIADTYSAYLDDLNASPDELEYIDDRLNNIYQLERKHHVESVEELIAIQQSLEAKLSSITDGEDILADLEQQARAAKHEAMEAAKALSESRAKIAVKFAQELCAKAEPLSMKNITCDIQLTQAEMTPSGIDRVDFLFAFNKNQTPQPVGSTASGGEISRLMLVIKSIVAAKMQLPTIIFDEIDTGVSGEVGLRMGQMMLDISKRIQVIAITHLPQVAAQGACHLKVYKEDDEQSTRTNIKALSPEQRIGEIAEMLSGNHADDTARAAAQSLLNLTSK